MEGSCPVLMEMLFRLLYGVSEEKHKTLEKPVSLSIFDGGPSQTQIWKITLDLRETAVAQWLRRCDTNRKVADSIPAGVRAFFIDIKSFRSHYGPGVDSAPNRNEYQEHFLG